MTIGPKVATFLETLVCAEYTAKERKRGYLLYGRKMGSLLKHDMAKSPPPTVLPQRIAHSLVLLNLDMRGWGVGPDLGLVQKYVLLMTGIK